MRALLMTICVVLSWATAACTSDAAQPSGAAGAPAAQAPPPPVAAPVVVTADELPPRLRVDGDGITLTEQVDGRVRLKSTAAWGEALDLAFDDCEFYRAAIPTLERQLAPERAKYLGDVCVPPPPVPQETVEGKGGRGALPGAAKPKAATGAPATPKLPQAKDATPKAAEPAAPTTAPSR
jgi:hypothetical protein